MDDRYGITSHIEANGNGTDPTHPLFQTLGKHGPYQEEGLTHKSVDCLIQSVVKKALIQKRVHPHVMRHTFATTPLDNGNELKTVRHWIGYSRIRGTETCPYSTDDPKIRVIRSLRFGVLICEGKGFWVRGLLPCFSNSTIRCSIPPVNQ